jgi:HEAT repeat protein
MESNLSRQLTDFIQQHREAATEAIKTLIKQNRIDINSLSEGLRWIGRIKDPALTQQCRLLLEDCLFHSSYYVQDGAVCGLGSMDDPLSIPVLQQAIQQETDSLLRRDMEQLLEQLIETAKETK